MKLVLKNALAFVNGTDFSDHVSSVTVETSRDEVDASTLASLNKETLAGLGDASMTMNFLQDFDAGEVDAVLWPLSSSDTPFLVAVRPKNAAISATNPEYQLTVLMFNYSPIDGSVGELLQTSVTFRNSSVAGLVRDITP